MFESVQTRLCEVQRVPLFSDEFQDINKINKIAKIAKINKIWGLQEVVLEVSFECKLSLPCKQKFWNSECFPQVLLEASKDCAVVSRKSVDSQLFRFGVKVVEVA